MFENPQTKPPGAGQSSYDLVDHEKVFQELRLRKGMNFLDMACGPGDYAVAVARRLGDEGVVYAADLWEEALVRLRKKAETQNIPNIKTIVGDVSRRLPVEAAMMDVCFIAAVLHDFVREEVAFEALDEAARVLKPEGVLAVLEFKKIDGPPGPPREIRLAPEELEGLVLPHGFTKERMSDVGPYHYMIIFRRNPDT
jgi:ubiquinone/menaquinone biosynthesis C-methylase UbiE